MLASGLLSTSLRLGCMPGALHLPAGVKFNLALASLVRSFATKTPPPPPPKPASKPLQSKPPPGKPPPLRPPPLKAPPPKPLGTKAPSKTPPPSTAKPGSTDTRKVKGGTPIAKGTIDHRRQRALQDAKERDKQLLKANEAALAMAKKRADLRKAKLQKEHEAHKQRLAKEKEKAKLRDQQQKQKAKEKMLLEKEKRLQREASEKEKKKVLKQKQAKKEQAEKDKAKKPKTRDEIIREINEESRPRRAISAYFLYSQEHMPQMRKSRSDLLITEVVKLLAKQWNELPEDQKKKYFDTANKDKERVAKEKVEWEQTRIKAPKRPRNAYTFFVVDACKEFQGDMTNTQRMKLFAQKWKSADDAAMKHYTDLAAKDAERYQKENEAFEKKFAKLQKAREESASSS